MGNGGVGGFLDGVGNGIGGALQVVGGTIVGDRAAVSRGERTLNYSGNKFAEVGEDLNKAIIGKYQVDIYGIIDITQLNNIKLTKCEGSVAKSSGLIGRGADVLGGIKPNRFGKALHATTDAFDCLSAAIASALQTNSALYNFWNSNKQHCGCKFITINKEKLMMYIPNTGGTGIPSIPSKVELPFNLYVAKFESKIRGNITIDPDVSCQNSLFVVIDTIGPILTYLRNQLWETAMDNLRDSRCYGCDVRHVAPHDSIIDFKLSTYFKFV